MTFEEASKVRSLQSPPVVISAAIPAGKIQLSEDVGVIPTSQLAPSVQSPGFAPAPVQVKSPISGVNLVLVGLDAYKGPQSVPQYPTVPAKF